MRYTRVLAVAKKNLRSLKHDRRTVAFIVIVPLLIMTIFGYTFGGDVKDIPTYIVNLDTGSQNISLSSSMIDEMLKDKTLEVLVNYGIEDIAKDPVNIAREKVVDGEIWAAIIFQPNFTRDAVVAIDSLKAGEQFVPSGILVYLDNSNPNIAGAVINLMTSSIQSVLGSDFGMMNPVVISPDILYGENAEFIDFFAPGVMGLAAMMVTFMLSIISFVHERKTATLDRLLSSPVTEGEIVGGYAIAFGLVGLLQSAVILVTAVLLFNIEIVGNALLALALIFLLGVGTQGLGFLLSSVARNEFQAVQFMPLILFPSILLAGVFWPIESIPEFLRPASYFIPLTYAVEGCRSVMIRGWGVEGVAMEIVILTAVAAAMLLMSTYALKRRQ